MAVMKRRYKEKNNVLLVNITRLGDMLQATPTIAGIKQENPDCKITVIVEKQFESICYWLPYIDEVVALDLGMMVRSLARSSEGFVDAFDQISDVVDDLRSRNFDFCLNMSSSAYTALLLQLVGIERHGGWRADPEGYRMIESEWAKLFASSVFHQNRQFNSFNLVDIFRCSADVDSHPRKLQITVDDEATKYCHDLITAHNFTNKGPLVAVQAGASQEKRQWAPAKFARVISRLLKESDARIVLTGTKKELPIIEQIVQQVESTNVMVAAGKTNIPQVSALLALSDILITGDTGPMHISVAAGTPVVAMFLASAYGYETGPYSEGNLVLQPVIGCGPCNPNKACAKPDCHDMIDPDLIVELVKMRLKGDVTELPKDLARPTEVVVYRSFFDDFGFCDLAPLTDVSHDAWAPYRNAYRKMWLYDLAGIETEPIRINPLQIVSTDFGGMPDLISKAITGQQLIDQLISYIRDTGTSSEKLRSTNQAISALDREIEELGFHYAPLGSVTRMFIFGKENLVGSDALALASQMKEVYRNLKNRTEKLAHYLGN